MQKLSRLVSKVGETVGEAGSGLISATTSDNNGQRCSRAAIISGSHLDAGSVTDGEVEGIGGSGGHPPLGGGDDFGAALGKAPGDG